MGVAAVVATPVSTGAQAPARGQNIAPVYEGFWRNADGSFDLMFGYYNRNWEEQIDVPWQMQFLKGGLSNNAVASTTIV